MKTYPPTYNPFVVEVDNICLSMEARLTDTLTLEWIADPKSTIAEYRGMLVLVKDNIRLVVAENLPEKACEALFHNLLDAYKSQGQEPVITYCSFD